MRLTPFNNGRPFSKFFPARQLSFVAPAGLFLDLVKKMPRCGRRRAIGRHAVQFAIDAADCSNWSISPVRPSPQGDSASQ